jgi:hypothetical protein
MDAIEEGAVCRREKPRCWRVELLARVAACALDEQNIIRIVILSNTTSTRRFRAQTLALEPKISVLVG